MSNEIIKKREKEDINANTALTTKWILVENGKGVCGHCNRQDTIDPLAKYCRFCGARILI